MPHHAKKLHLSASTKIAIAIIVVVGIVALLFYSPDEGIASIGKINAPDIGLPNILGGNDVPEGSLSFILTSDKNLLSNRLDLKNATVSIDGVHEDDTVLGDVVLDNKGERDALDFEGFDGRIIILSNTLSVDGSATSTTSGDTKIKPKSNTFSVQAELEPESFTIGPLDISDLELIGISGNIESIGKEKGSINLADSDLEISNFKGILRFDGDSYKLTGSAREIQGASFTLKN